MDFIIERQQILNDRKNRSRDSDSLSAPAYTLAQYLQKERISSVLLGLSGGADSMLAFHLLRLAGDTLSGVFSEDFRLGIVHVNFHLRGEESDRDEAFVRKALEEFPDSGEQPIATFFADYDTSAYCRENHLSLEMGARRLRHDLFRKIADKEDFDRIATGHNADDNEETLLLNLLRGSGSRGLRGMRPDNGRILRPLLGLHRDFILQLLDSSKWINDLSPKYITDSSNLENEFCRNFIRNSIMPQLAGRWEGIHSQLQLTLANMREENKIVEAAIREALEGRENSIPWDVISSFPSPSTLLHTWVIRHGGSADIAREILSHVPNPGDICITPGRRWNLPNGATILTTYFELKIEQDDSGKLHIFRDGAPFYKYADVFESIEEKDIEESERRELMQRVRKCPLTEAYLPGEAEDYYWRFPRKGDRVSLFGGAGSKLVSDILKEAGVPLKYRSKFMILCRAIDDEIIWIPKARRSGKALIDSNTHHYIHITL